MKGKNIEIPKGTEITAYVAADTNLKIAKESTTQVAPTSTEQGVAPTQSSSDVAASVTATLIVKSDPSGAEITIGEKFMGTTQSTLKLQPGEHIVTITKTGYKEWKRTITLNAGSEIKLEASLEKTPEIVR